VTMRIARTTNKLFPDRRHVLLAGFPSTNSRAPRVRIDERREVNQMLKLFTFVQAAADSLRKREEGQTMAEYGVVLAVITLAVIGAITLLSDNVRAAIENVAGILPG
jgi:Flp pilus assembly pilin Flp